MGIFDFLKRKNNSNEDNNKNNKAQSASKADNTKIEHETQDFIYDGSLRMVYECNIKNGTYIVPKNAIYIEPYAFKGCEDKLVRVVLHKNLKFICYSAFAGCDKLQRVEGLKDNTVMKLLDGFAGCKNLRYIEVPESIEIINREAFSGCKKLEEFDLPKGVWSVGDSAFKNCKNLQEIDFSSKIAGVGSGAFSGCEDLVVSFGGDDVPENIVTHIGGKKISIPGGNVTIGKDAFKDVRGVFTKFPNNISEIIKSGYDGMMGYYDAEEGRMITVDLGAIDMFHEGME